MALFTLKEVEYTVSSTLTGKRRLLSGINLEIEEGQVFTVIGPSGAGKSTLLYLLNRFKDATAGVINYAGRSLQEYPVTELRREVGMLLQKPYMLPGTVKDNLLAGPALYGQHSQRSPEELLHMVGLTPSLLKQEARSLSGGEQQRISLARLLANQPRVLLLDEPTAALNQGAAEEIEHLISQLVQQHDLTVIMITHDLGQAHRLGTVTALLLEGRLAEVQSTPRFFQSPESQAAQQYLEENWHEGRGVNGSGT